MVLLLIMLVTIYRMLTVDNEMIESTTAIINEEAPVIGHFAPQFSLPSLDGQDYSLDRVEGKSMLLNFWASWCEPCKIEAPDLVNLYENYSDKIEIYAINVTANDTIDNVISFADEYGFTFPVLLDEHADIAKSYKVRPIPTTFFINKDGVIVDIVVGPLNKNLIGEKLKLLIESN